MHANFVTLDYKSAADADAVIAKLEQASSKFDDAAGFISFHLARTGETQTKHVVLFQDEASFEVTRERLYPVLLELAGDHLAAPPELRPGAVVLQKAG